MTRFMRSEPTRSLSIKCSTICWMLHVPGTGSALSCEGVSPAIASAGRVAPRAYSSINERSIVAFTKADNSSNRCEHQSVTPSVAREWDSRSCGPIIHPPNASTALAAALDERDLVAGGVVRDFVHEGADQQ